MSSQSCFEGNYLNKELMRWREAYEDKQTELLSAKVVRQGKKKRSSSLSNSKEVEVSSVVETAEEMRSKGQAQLSLWKAW